MLHKVFIKGAFRNFLENIRVGVSFLIKLNAQRLQPYYKKTFLTQGFSSVEEHLFYGTSFRSSHLDVSSKKRSPWKLRKIHRKTPGMTVCSFIEKKLQHWRFPVNFSKFLVTPALQNICWRLLLTFGLLFLSTLESKTTR